MKNCTFEYSANFKNLIIDLHKGKENLSSWQGYIDAHLGGDKSRYYAYATTLLPEIKYRCGELANKRVLDFGCGTGATTAMLALEANEIVAYDIDKKSIDICKQRMQEHKTQAKITFLSGDFSSLKDTIGIFDFILVNGVIEHIPLSQKGLRKRIISDLLSLLRVGGYLYINDTPNRLFPYDFHTTQLWLLPWLRPGSALAYRIALKKDRHIENSSSHSRGPLGLEERGVWGATYFELKKYLSGHTLKILNCNCRQNRHLVCTQKTTLSFKRKLFEETMYYLFTKWFRIPLTCFSPYLNHLVIQKV